MATATVPLTLEGHERLKAELKTLKSVDRPKVILDIAEARAHGDLSENAEYHAAKEKQGFIEARIAILEDRLSRAQVVIPDGRDADKVGFGAWVTVSDEETGETKTYRIVGDLEADTGNNLISVSSPLARALLGKRLDDLVEFRAPKGVIEYSIAEVKYP